MRVVPSAILFKSAPILTHLAPSHTAKLGLDLTHVPLAYTQTFTSDVDLAFETT